MLWQCTSPCWPAPAPPLHHGAAPAATATAHNTTSRCTRTCAARHCRWPGCMYLRFADSTLSRSIPFLCVQLPRHSTIWNGLNANTEPSHNISFGASVSLLVGPPEWHCAVIGNGLPIKRQQHVIRLQLLRGRRSLVHTPNQHPCSHRAIGRGGMSGAQARHTIIVWHCSL